MLFSKTAVAMEGEFSNRLEGELRNHKAKYIIQGLGFIIGGALAAVMPSAMALNATLILGVILLLTGIFQMVLTIKSKMHWWSMMSSLLSIIIGLFILWKPLSVLLAFVTLLALFMTIEGICELFLAFQFRPLKNWNWMLVTSLITLTLATVLWIGFPAFDILYLGWIIAANLMLYGLSLLMLVWKIAS